MQTAMVLHLMCNKTYLLIIVFILLGNEYGLSQNESSIIKDTLVINGHLGLRGRWQTGNLNQISLMPNVGLSMNKSSYNIEFGSTYHFLRVNGFNVKDDLWTYGLYQHQPNQLIFPSVHTIMGYASSFKIDHSIVVGAGAGSNILKKSPARFLQLHLFGAYFNFEYEAEDLHEAFAIGGLLRTRLPVGSHTNFLWELSTYHSTKETEFWGGSNLLQLNFTVFKNLILNISHRTYYSNQTATNIKNTNTEMLFGIQYIFSNN